ncbi:hypothetical protein [Clostridium sp. UBA7339]
MSKFCKNMCLIGIFVLLCATVIGIPKNGEHPPLLGSISSSELL